MKRRIKIRDRKTNEVVKSIETEFRGHNYEKLLAGMYTKADSDRFYIHEDTQNTER